MSKAEQAEAEDEDEVDNPDWHCCERCCVCSSSCLVCETSAASSCISVTSPSFVSSIESRLFVLSEMAEDEAELRNCGLQCEFEANVSERKTS